jgi:hypothetical protein
MPTRLNIYGQGVSTTKKKPCIVATTENIALSGATTPITIDGISISVGNRILVRQQNSPQENGIYRLATSELLSRDYDFNINEDLYSGVEVLVLSGATYSGKTFYLTTSGDIIIGSSSLSFGVLTGQNGTSGTSGGAGSSGASGTSGTSGGAGSSGVAQMAVIRETTSANVGSSVTYTNSGSSTAQSKPRQFNSKTEAGLSITLNGAPNWTFTISTVGTYLFEATAMLSVPSSDGQTMFAKLLLNNQTLSLGSVIVGDSFRYGPISSNQLLNSNFPHTMNGIYTITGTTVFSLDHVTISQYFSPTGGKPSNISTYEEVYATLKITKIN